jgi:hypothetical protein
MKNSTKTLERNGPAFSFLCEKFPRLSRKIKVGIFIDPQICRLIKDPKLDLALSDDEKPCDMLQLVFDEMWKPSPSGISWRILLLLRRSLAATCQ